MRHVTVGYRIYEFIVIYNNCYQHENNIILNYFCKHHKKIAVFIFYYYYYNNFNFITMIFKGAI